MTLKKNADEAAGMRLATWLDSISRKLAKAIAILLAILVLTQLAFQNDYIRHVMTSADRWEGTRLN